LRQLIKTAYCLYKKQSNFIYLGLLKYDEHLGHVWIGLYFSFKNSFANKQALC